MSFLFIFIEFKIYSDTYKLNIVFYKAMKIYQMRDMKQIFKRFTHISVFTA